MVTKPKYRFTGHETFPCRYAWLPKAVMAIQKSPRILSSEDEAMVELGVGKNMVRAIRFWATVTGIALNRGADGWEITPLGNALLGQSGLDPYLEDSQTLWLLHWKLATQFDEPLFAWDYLLSRWHEPEFTRTSALSAFEKETRRQERKLSRTTLSHHLDAFIHTYVPTSGAKPSVFEDGLDCPLVELNLIFRVGDRISDVDGARREPIYTFRREEKPDISPHLFAYCVADFAVRKHPDDTTVSFRELAIGNCSPGQVFKLPEATVRARLEHIGIETNGLLSFEESADIQQLTRRPDVRPLDMLPSIYRREITHA
ncbi:MAG TPA: DUF4007 family protein [Myxococcota bacterium]|nr:DUF4007 family protein [Myxococcota bacterium]